MQANIIFQYFNENSCQFCIPPFEKKVEEVTIEFQINTIDFILDGKRWADKLDDLKSYIKSRLTIISFEFSVIFWVRNQFQFHGLRNYISSRMLGSAQKQPGALLD